MSVNTGPTGDPDEWLAGFEEKMQILSDALREQMKEAGWERRLRMALAQLTSQPLDNMRGRHDTK